MTLQKPLLICVVGATAIGKTALSIALAKAFKTEVLSADSRQFYKEMSIGTAVPTAEELAAVPHHFIQHKSIFETYTVGDFEKEAVDRLENLFKKKSIVIMAGGSGLYIDAVVKGLDTFPSVASEIREQLNKELSLHGLEFLQKELKEVDEASFSRMDIHNPHRVIRALEIYRGSGKTYSSFLNKNTLKRSFDTLFIGLTAERNFIYERINTRVDRMIEEGLLQEAEALLAHKELNALQTVGYKELFDYFERTWTKEQAIEEIKKNTRRFAKRQGTWFRKNSAIQWFDATADHKKIVQEIKVKNALL